MVGPLLVQARRGAGSQLEEEKNRPVAQLLIVCFLSDWVEGVLLQDREGEELVG